MTQKDDIIQKKNVRIEQMNEDIQRRQYLEKKVQVYVKSLCLQN